MKKLLLSLSLVSITVVSISYYNIGSVFINKKAISTQRNNSNENISESSEQLTRDASKSTFNPDYPDINKNVYGIKIDTGYVTDKVQRYEDFNLFNVLNYANSWNEFLEYYKTISFDLTIHAFGMAWSNDVVLDGNQLTSFSFATSSITTTPPTFVDIKIESLNQWMGQVSHRAAKGFSWNESAVGLSIWRDSNDVKLRVAYYADGTNSKGRATVDSSFPFTNFTLKSSVSSTLYSSEINSTFNSSKPFSITSTISPDVNSIDVDPKYSKSNKELMINEFVRRIKTIKNYNLVFNIQNTGNSNLDYYNSKAIATLDFSDNYVTFDNENSTMTLRPIIKSGYNSWIPSSITLTASITLETSIDTNLPNLLKQTKSFVTDSSNLIDSTDKNGTLSSPTPSNKELLDEIINNLKVEIWKVFNPNRAATTANMLDPGPILNKMNYSITIDNISSKVNWTFSPKQGYTNLFNKIFKTTQNSMSFSTPISLIFSNSYSSRGLDFSLSPSKIFVGKTDANPTGMVDDVPEIIINDPNKYDPSSTDVDPNSFLTWIYHGPVTFKYKAKSSETGILIDTVTLDNNAVEVVDGVFTDVISTETETPHTLVIDYKDVNNKKKTATLNIGIRKSTSSTLGMSYHGWDPNEKADKSSTNYKQYLLITPKLKEVDPETLEEKEVDNPYYHPEIDPKTGLAEQKAWVYTREKNVLNKDGTYTKVSDTNLAYAPDPTLEGYISNPLNQEEKDMNAELEKENLGFFANTVYAYSGINLNAITEDKGVKSVDVYRVDPKTLMRADKTKWNEATTKPTPSQTLTSDLMEIKDGINVSEPLVSFQADENGQIDFGGEENGENIWDKSGLWEFEMQLNDSFDSVSYKPFTNNLPPKNFESKPNDSGSKLHYYVYIPEKDSSENILNMGKTFETLPFVENNPNIQSFSSVNQQFQHLSYFVTTNLDSESTTATLDALDYETTFYYWKQFISAHSSGRLVNDNNDSSNQKLTFLNGGIGSFELKFNISETDPQKFYNEILKKISSNVSQKWKPTKEIPQIPELGLNKDYAVSLTPATKDVNKKEPDMISESDLSKLYFDDTNEAKSIELYLVAYSTSKIVRNSTVPTKVTLINDPTYSTTPADLSLVWPKDYIYTDNFSSKSQQSLIKNLLKKINTDINVYLKSEYSDSNITIPSFGTDYTLKLETKEVGFEPDDTSTSITLSSMEDVNNILETSDTLLSNFINSEANDLNYSQLKVTVESTPDSKNNQNSGSFIIENNNTYPEVFEKTDISELFSKTTAESMISNNNSYVEREEIFNYFKNLNKENFDRALSQESPYSDEENLNFSAFTLTYNKELSAEKSTAEKEVNVFSLTPNYNNKAYSGITYLTIFDQVSDEDKLINFDTLDGDLQTINYQPVINEDEIFKLFTNDEENKIWYSALPSKIKSSYTFEELIRSIFTLDLNSVSIEDDVSEYYSPNGLEVFYSHKINVSGIKLIKKQESELPTNIQEYFSTNDLTLDLKITAEFDSNQRNPGGDYFDSESSGGDKNSSSFDPLQLLWMVPLILGSAFIALIFIIRTKRKRATRKRIK